MYVFFCILSIVALISFVVALICLVADADPFGLWVALFICSLVITIISSGGMACTSVEEAPEHPKHEITTQYNYCPYCGEEIK